MHNYVKEKRGGLNIANLTTDELIAKVTQKRSVRTVVPLFCVFFVFISVVAVITTNKLNCDESDNGLISFVNPIAATSNAKKDLISIPAGTVKKNPFLPYRNIEGSSSVDNSLPAFELIAPPEVISEGSDAARIMDTIVSGILYDKYSPSAILNIEGNDYLVKKGDVVNNYKVLDIEKDSVTVKLGANTFKAGIGEILTEGTVNINDVSNLGKKFGGERK